MTMELMWGMMVVARGREGCWPVVSGLLVAEKQPTYATLLLGAAPKQRRNRAAAALLCCYPWPGCGVGGCCNSG